MKHFAVFLSSLLVFVSIAFGQQDPQFSQNMYNRLSINPAYAGSNDAICATMLGRNQWAGFEGAPKTGLLSVDAMFDQIHGGVGLTASYDKLGFDQTLSLRLAYAYRMNLGPGKLGIGIDVGLMQKTIDGKWVATDAGDVSIPPSAESASAPDFSLGAYYHTNDLYFGFSTTHLVESELSYSTIQTKMARHYYLMGGYKYDIGRDMVLKPSVLIKSDAASTQIDLNTNLLYKDMFWGGLSYRFTDAIVALVGINYGNFKFGYAYDITTSAIRRYSNGSHEIMLGYCFKPTSTKPLPLNRNIRFL